MAKNRSQTLLLICLFTCGCAVCEKAYFSEEQLKYAYRFGAPDLQNALSGDNKAVSRIFRKAVSDELDGEYAELYVAELYHLASGISPERLFEVLRSEPENVQREVLNVFLPVAQRDRRLSKVRGFLLEIQHDG
jgi:hypothetical protein